MVATCVLVFAAALTCRGATDTWVGNAPPIFNPNTLWTAPGNWASGTVPPNGADLRFASGDVTTVHAELLAAAGGKDVWVVGGGDLAGQFADAGLLDEIVAAIAPVTLGAGRPVFPRRYALQLTDVARNGAFACARYAVLGPRTTDWSA